MLGTRVARHGLGAIGKRGLIVATGSGAANMAIGYGLSYFSCTPYTLSDALTQAGFGFFTAFGVRGSRLGGAGEDSSGILFRTGARTDNALTDPSGVSFRDSISSSADRSQVFRPGDKIWAVDAAKLPLGSVVRDGVPAGHVTVRAKPAAIRDAIVDDVTLRDLGLKPLEDIGAYKLPR
jgi:hypothetical protein